MDPILPGRPMRRRIRTDETPLKRTLELAALRRHTVAAQSFAPKAKKATAQEIARCVERLSCVQLDSISTVERSHLLVLTSRLGPISPEKVWELLKEGHLIEYWAHEACLLPGADWPHYRHRMKERQSHHWWGPVIQSDPQLAERILKQIRDLGPQGSRHFEGKGGGGMWNLKPAKKMLDALWTAGDLVVSGRLGFQRLYDLPERVLAPAIFQATDPEVRETRKHWILRAVKARGALTQRGLVDHYRFKGGTRLIEPILRELCADGLLEQWEVEDGGPPVYIAADSDPRESPEGKGAVFLSPFENMLWDRAFNKRVFGFNHLIEVYKKPHQRIYGYYVLPLLVGDRVVARADLKSHRERSLLEMKAFHWEEGVRPTKALKEKVEMALKTLATNLGLAEIESVGF